MNLLTIRISALNWADILVAYAFFVMQKYLTDVWKLSFTHAAGILNIWGGISRILPVFLLFLVDALLGNFKMLLISTTAYTLGIGFIAISAVLADSTETCEQYEPECIGHTQEVLFYTGMALLAVGMAGNLVSTKPFRKEQKDKLDDDDDFQSFVSSFLLFWAAFVPVIGAIALPYIEPWSLRFGIPAIFTAFVTLHFLSGSLEYHKVDPQGSPLTNVCRVFVAFVCKISEPFPNDPKRLYSEDDENHRPNSSTRSLRCLDKAAIILPDIEFEDQVNNRWRLCSLEEVEEARIVVRMIPMWITFIICGIISAMGNTYFIEQASHMNRKLGNWEVPLQILLLFYGLARSLFSSLAASFSEGPRKYRHRVGIAIAMIFSILCCITAARIEKRRINVIRSHGLLDKPDDDIPMSVYWLLFQFFLLAGLDSFLEKSSAAIYKNHAPKSMKNYLSNFTKAVYGLGFMFGVLSVYVVGKVSEKGGGTNWFQHTSNRSRLDRYYWVLAALSSVNLVVFILVAWIYKYDDREVRLADDENEEE